LLMSNSISTMTRSIILRSKIIRTMSCTRLSSFEAGKERGEAGLVRAFDCYERATQTTLLDRSIDRSQDDRCADRSINQGRTCGVSSPV
jgi:hypothetical protein